jgi:hypothetical protein
MKCSVLWGITPSIALNSNGLHGGTSTEIELFNLTIRVESKSTFCESRRSQSGVTREYSFLGCERRIFFYFGARALIWALASLHETLRFTSFY